jgi:hypothetical protein
MFRFTIRDVLWLTVPGINLGEAVLSCPRCGQTYERG